MTVDNPLRKEKREIQHWHMRVALHHLRQVQPDILHHEVLVPWAKVTKEMEMLEVVLK